jgi:hypothetical protein
MRKYNAELLTGQALVQEYNLMINEGNIQWVLLHVPYDDPCALYYYLCEPSMDVDLGDDQSLRQPKTAVAGPLSDELSIASSESGVA